LIKKHFALLLMLWIGAVSLIFPALATAQSNTDTGKTRAKVQTLSASRDQDVEVKFRDKTKVKGRITKVEPVSFTLRDEKTGTSQTIAYSEVESISKSGGISTKTWLIIGGVAAGAVTTWLIVKPAFCDGGASTRGIC
jgi:small nuclear ribonucleoprotein (snRNP)-like protein